MNIYFQYPYSNVIPDELDYLKEILAGVLDYFFHDDINFYITNDVNIELNTSNNIVFLTGSEKSGCLRDQNFILCFTNFYRSSSDERYVAIPLGNNKFINNLILNYCPIPFHKREYDVFFAGFIHPTRIKFAQCLERLKCKKYIHYTKANNLQNFQNSLNPSQYLDILRNSKVVMAPIGAHHCTSYRYFESIYFGNIVFTQKLEDQKIFHDLQFKNQYIIKDWESITDLTINEAIKNYDEDECVKNHKLYFSKHSVISLIINKINSQIETSNTK